MALGGRQRQCPRSGAATFNSQTGADSPTGLPAISTRIFGQARPAPATARKSIPAKDGGDFRSGLAGGEKRGKGRHAAAMPSWMAQEMSWLLLVQWSFFLRLSR